MHYALVLILLLATTAVAEDQATFAPPTCDPSRVVGFEQCAKCHTAEVAQWKQTPHHQTFEQLHRTPEAKHIVDKLGLRTVKRNDMCVQCHYTQQQQGSRVRTVSGVSCESCHGEAKDWIDVHADYGGPNVTAATEPPTHRQQRRAAAIAAGMNNPSNLYLIARQCFNCHTVPNERLVNVGGHQAGSHDFELVSWSQGMVRHNFLRGGGSTNVPASRERLRVMFVVGVMADLEFSLRATAEATQQATFGRASANRAAHKKRRLIALQQAIDDPHVAKALDAVRTVELKLGNRAAILAAADGVGMAAGSFAADADGSQLAAVDAWLPAPDSYK